jgi:hypothetical protein
MGRGPALPLPLVLVVAAAAATAASSPGSQQVSLPQVEKMASLPRNYRYTDYAGIAVSLDAWLFDKAPPELGLWCAGSAAGRSASYTGPAWGIPSYAGADRAPCNIQGPCLDKWEPGEGIPLMGSLLAAAYFGIDKSLPVAALNGSSLFDSVFLYVGGAADLPLVSDHVLWAGQALGVAGSSW